MFTVYMIALAMIITGVFSTTLFFQKEKDATFSKKIEKERLIVNNDTVKSFYPDAEEKHKELVYKNFENLFLKVCTTVWTTAKRNCSATVNVDSPSYVWSFLGTTSEKTIDDIVKWAYANPDCSAVFDCLHPENYACFLIKQEFPGYTFNPLPSEFANITVSVATTGLTNATNPCAVSEILLK